MVFFSFEYCIKIYFPYRLVCIHVRTYMLCIQQKTVQCTFMYVYVLSVDEITSFFMCGCFVRALYVCTLFSYVVSYLMIAHV